MSVFNKSITIKRAAKSLGTMGGEKFDWNNPTIIASNVAASIQSMTPRESEQYQRQGTIANVKVFIKQSLDVRQNDRIQDPDISTRYYVVVAPVDMGGRGRFFKIVTRQVN